MGWRPFLVGWRSLLVGASRLEPFSAEAPHLKTSSASSHQWGNPLSQLKIVNMVVGCSGREEAKLPDYPMLK